MAPGDLFRSVHRRFRQGRANFRPDQWVSRAGIHAQMIKSFVVAAALTIGFAGYALAQDTVTGAPAGTAPMKPAPMTHMHHHTHHHIHHHHDMAAPMAAPADAPK